MLGQLLIVAAAAFVVIGSVAFLFVVAVRAKLPVAVRAMRAISRLVNPLVMRSAGKAGVGTSVIRYTGRVTGNPYATPVGAVPEGDGFVISLPYGTRSQWVRNVLASGSATLLAEGHEYAVDRPELIPLASVEKAFSPADQQLHRLFGVDQVLRVRRT